MPYQRSLDIEQRLKAVLQMISTGKYSTPRLAEELRVSIPTISRCVTALRERGHDIRAEKLSEGWHYVLDREVASKSSHSRNRSSSTLAARHPR